MLHTLGGVLFNSTERLTFENCKVSAATFQASGPKSIRTRRRQNDFAFFPIRDIPLRLMSVKLIFSAPNRLICPIFVKKSMTV